MCGISGQVDFGRDLRGSGDIAAGMADSMACRGPDAHGVWLSRHAALGHRRLAVIDVEGGAQPMVAEEDGAPVAVITYSGEVYNFSGLRRELSAAGHRFRTRSDTEVVLRAYLHWGADAVTRLVGMFAFAIWDVRARQLLLVRDRLGVKPLYYAPLGGGVLFGSEPKAILAHPEFPAEVDAEGLAELFAVPAAPTPGAAVYRGMRAVRPGHVVRVSPEGVTETRYWGLESHPHPHDLPTTVRTVRDLLADIVAGQLVSDVPLGLLLSGGLDSTAVTALAAAHTRGAGGTDKLATFAVEFPADERPETLGAWNSEDDAPYARAAAAHLGTAHTVVVVAGTELAAERGVGLAARDLPGWGEPDVSLHLLFRGIRRHVTVALSGEVADEVFGGYPYFHDPAAVAADTFPWLHAAVLPEELLTPEARAEIRPGRYRARRYREALAEVPRLAGETPRDARLREIGHLALTRWLPALLDRKDRMSMAAGLEVRVPFADHRLAEYLWNVPWDHKTPGGAAKGLLRRAVGDLLPAAVAHRRKSGYPASSADSYATALRDGVRELLATPDAPVFTLVDRSRIRRALAAGQVLPGPRAAPHPTGGLDYLLALDAWLRGHRVRIR
ncbi:asparagine synthase (glutamine-hydrolyzing) [Marinactinospora rubrisoli]|uniref:asparagine synthase (glutamine-hydrolyzing) n=1 Tax=Marinactinospora rubrisoli TaxID=2715399 RepID=A0ABW2KD74_9ACTN